MRSPHYNAGCHAALNAVGLIKTAARAPQEAPYEVRLQDRFARLTDALHRYGQYTGTGHKRILIPQRVLSEEDINALGFVPTTAAIPEAGQSQFSSFRHPGLQYHLHAHEGGWTMHEDDEQASTMIAHRGNSQPGVGVVPKTLRTVASTIKGLPHTINEGVPGLAYYLKGRLLDEPTMKQRLVETLPTKFFQEMQSWKPLRPPTPTPTPAPATRQ